MSAATADKLEQELGLSDQKEPRNDYNIVSGLFLFMELSWQIK
jgi:hypothetical protein